MSHAIATNRFVPSRFVGGVASTDACLYAYDGQSRLRLHLPEYARDLHDATHGTRRRSMHAPPLVFWHDLYPIVPPGMAFGPHTDLPIERADTEAWQRALWHMGYQPVAKVDSYHAMIGGERGLFGTSINPIASVVRLAMRLDEASKKNEHPGIDMLMHYLLTVTMQYYLLARGAWVEVRTDAEASYHERLPPYLFLLFPLRDWCVSDPETMPLFAPIAADWSNLAEEATKRSLPEFLYQVGRWLCQHHLVEHNAFRHAFDTELLNWCGEKLRKNFMQTLTCMRFREVVPCDLLEHLQRRGVEGAKETQIKFFAHPNACNMPSVSTKAAIVPQLFYHLFFTPTEPVLIDDDERHLMWRLMLYYPLSLYKQGVSIPAKKLWPQGVFPQTAVEKYVQYNAYIPLSPVRARYCFYVYKDKAYAFVPNLLLPSAEEGVTMADEWDVRHMTPRAWRWCVARGSTLPHTHRKVAGTDPDAVVAHHQLQASKPEALSLWLYFWAVCFATHSEEYACAVVANKFGATLEELQHSYQAMNDEADQRLASYSFAALHEVWDRCTALTPIDDVTAVWWRFLFPVSIIGFENGDTPWIHAWRPMPSVPHTRTAITRIQKALTRSVVAKELLQATDDDLAELTDDQRWMFTWMRAMLQRNTIKIESPKSGESSPRGGAANALVCMMSDE